jgi:hypothetical protein
MIGTRKNRDMHILGPTGSVPGTVLVSMGFEPKIGAGPMGFEPTTFSLEG